MKYMFLIYEDDTDPAVNAPEVGTAYGALAQDWRARGMHLGGQALQPRETATTVRVRDRDRILTDGPFTETKEVLAGYMILDCKDLDQAIDCAAQMPTASFGAIEIRPIHQ
jgi:hypothetical protein